MEYIHFIVLPYLYFYGDDDGMAQELRKANLHVNILIFRYNCYLFMMMMTTEWDLSVLG